MSAQECRMQCLLECRVFGAKYHTDRHEQLKRVTFVTSCSAETPGRVVAAKMCPDQPRAFKKVNSPAFPQEETFVFPFFSERAGVHDSKPCPLQDSRKRSKIWLRRANIKSHLTPKVNPILKLCSYQVQGNYATTQVTHVFRTKAQMFTEFLGNSSWFFCAYSVSPCRPVNEIWFCYFRREFWMP